MWRTTQHVRLKRRLHPTLSAPYGRSVISLNSLQYVSFGVYLNLKPCTGLRAAGALDLHFFVRNLHPMAQHPMKVNNNTIPIRIIDDSKTVISIGFQQFLASIIGAMTFPYLIVSAIVLIAPSQSKCPLFHSSWLLYTTNSS